MCFSASAVAFTVTAASWSNTAAALFASRELALFISGCGVVAAFVVAHVAADERLEAALEQHQLESETNATIKKSLKNLQFHFRLLLVHVNL
jgi:hypothetical protein